MAAKIHYNKKRLRMIAGPNGSGKSTIFEKLNVKYDTGKYLNADVLEKELSKPSGIDLNKFDLQKVSSKRFKNFIKEHSLTQKAVHDGYKIDLDLTDNKITNPNKTTHSYEASIVVDFIRNELLKKGKKITFETVMSHASKIEILKNANKSGYKSYLYFIGTESEEINIKRVEQRVKTGGHNVDQDKIISRYFNSLNLLKDAVKNSYRSFIFDNSRDEALLILEVFKGKEITYHTNEIPHWVDKYLLNK